MKKLKFTLIQALKSGFWANTAQLVSGTVVAQLIPILLQPFLRRVFTPEEYGVFAVYFSIVSVLSIVATLNYQTSIVLPEKEEDAMTIVLGSLTISVIVNIIICIFFFFLGSYLIRGLHLPTQLHHWIWFLPLSILLNSFNLILSNWLIRKKKFRQLSTNKIIRRVSEGGAQIGLGYAAKKSGLIGGTIIGDFTNCLVYFFQYIKSGGKFRRDIYLNIPTLLARYKEFPIVALIPYLLDTLSAFLPIFMVSQFYSTDVTGQFDLSRQLLAIPLALVSTSLSQVLLHEFSTLKRERKSLIKRASKVFFFLLIASVAMCLFILFFGQQCILYLFGSEWKLGASISLILVWGYGIKLLVSPFSTLFIAFEKLKLNAVWQLSYFVIILSFYLFLHVNFNQFILILTAIDCTMFGVYGLLIYKLVIRYENSITT